MIRDMVFRINHTVDQAMIALHQYVDPLFYSLLLLDFILFWIFIILRKNQPKEIIFKMFIYGFFVYLLNNFEKISFTFLKSIVKLSSVIGGDFSPEFMTDPNSIILFALEEVLNPLAQAAGKINLWKLNMNQVMIFIAYPFILFCFIIITLQLIIAILQFHINLFMALVLYPFNVLKPTQFIGSKVFASVVGQAVNVGLIALVTGLSINIYRQVLYIPSAVELNISFLAMVLLATLLLSYLAFQVPALTSGLLSGVPNLGATGFVQNIIGMGAMVFGAAKIGRKASNTISNSRLGQEASFAGKYVKNKIDSAADVFSPQMGINDFMKQRREHFAGQNNFRR